MASNTVFRGLEGKAKPVPLALPTDLKPKEILLKITHASLCGTDVHLLPFGCALGHEGVGIVQKVGSEVTQFKVGDRAGAGYLRNVRSTFLMLEVLPSRCQNGRRRWQVLISSHRVVAIVSTV